MGRCMKVTCHICGKTIYECPCKRDNKKQYKKMCGKCNLLGDQKDNPIITSKKFCFNIGQFMFYTVNLKEVNDTFTQEFCESGSYKTFKFIPNNEIWIADNLDYWSFTMACLHEYTEVLNMLIGLNYDDAHMHASRMEDIVRDNLASKLPEGDQSLIAPGV